jgi:hypothetical protein
MCLPLSLRLLSNQVAAQKQHCEGTHRKHRYSLHFECLQIPWTETRKFTSPKSEILCSKNALKKVRNQPNSALLDLSGNDLKSEGTLDANKTPGG